MIASTVAALGAVLGGRLDDRFGAKPVIVASLSALIVLSLALLALSARWRSGCAGCCCVSFVGPTQSAARTQLLRMTGEGKEGVAFGLYTMTGRAVAFLHPGCSSFSSISSTPTGPAGAESAWCWSPD